MGIYSVDGFLDMDTIVGAYDAESYREAIRTRLIPALCPQGPYPNILSVVVREVAPTALIIASVPAPSPINNRCMRVGVVHVLVTRRMLETNNPTTSHC